MSRALGTDDSVDTCDCCGRSNLKFTVVVETDAGEIAHYGQVCAARNTGKPAKQINAEIKAQAQVIRDLAAAEYSNCAARRTYEEKMNRRPAGFYGRAAADFVRTESQDAAAARVTIARRFGLAVYEVHPYL